MKRHNWLSIFTAFFVSAVLVTLAGPSHATTSEVDGGSRKDISYSERNESEKFLEFDRGAFTILYSTDRRGPIWSKYYLPGDSSRLYNGERPATYRKDTRVASYDGSAFAGGYDRGHLVPAEDMRHYGEVAFYETFLTTNITPMMATLNRGAWATLESRGRALAKGNDGVFIFSGTHFDSPNPARINGVSVPSHFWKAFAWTDSNDKVQTKFWLIPNRDVKTEELPKFEIDQRTLEQKIGLSFLDGKSLRTTSIGQSSPDTLENAIKSGSLDRVKLTLSRSVSPWRLIEVTNDEGQNAIHLGAKSGNKDLVELLLSKAISPWKLLDTKDSAGQLPLHHAAINGDPSVVLLLLDKSISPWKLISETDSRGRTSLHYAAISGNSKTVQIILDKSVSSFSLKQKKDTDGRTPADLATVAAVKELLK